jgi:cob(I)alamin adenosyltransferase
MKEKEGLVYVFEGDGKGKTSAALGVALRMLLLQKRVEWISWFKEESWKTAEMKLPEVFEENLKMHWMGKGFYGGPMDHGTPEGHKRAALEALMLAGEILAKKEELGETLDLLVLDEVLRAIDSGFLDTKELLEVIKKRGGTHLILTGRECPADILDMVDLITEMKKVKHPFDKGVLAVPGLDF